MDYQQQLIQQRRELMWSEIERLKDEQSRPAPVFQTPASEMAGIIVASFLIVAACAVVGVLIGALGAWMR